MRRNLEALYSTLGRGGSALPPSGAAASSAQPTPTGAAGMAEHAWSAHGGGDLAAVGACTLGRYATPTTAVAPRPPLSMRPLMPATAIVDGSVIELTGELHEARGALEAERTLTERLNQQLAELTAKVARMAAERAAEKGEL